MLSRNTSTPPDSHSATPSSSDPPTPVRGRSEDPLARLTAGDATPKRNESLRRRMAKSMAVETKQGLAHVKQCGATHCTGYDGVHGVEDITLTIAGGSADAAAAFGLTLDADSRVLAVTKGSQAESCLLRAGDIFLEANGASLHDEAPAAPETQKKKRPSVTRSALEVRLAAASASCDVRVRVRLCQSNGSLVLRHRQREASQLAAAAQALAGEFDLAEIGRAELAAGDREAPTRMTMPPGGAAPPAATASRSLSDESKRRSVLAAVPTSLHLLCQMHPNNICATCGECKRCGRCVCGGGGDGGKRRGSGGRRAASPQPTGSAVERGERPPTSAERDAFFAAACALMTRHGFEPGHLPRKLEAYLQETDSGRTFLELQASSSTGSARPTMVWTARSSRGWCALCRSRTASAPHK